MSAITIIMEQTDIIKKSQTIAASTLLIENRDLQQKLIIPKFGTIFNFNMMLVILDGITQICILLDMAYPTVDHIIAMVIMLSTRGTA